MLSSTLLLALTSSDVDVLREDGSGRVATVLQDTARGWDTTVYPHCLFVDNPQFVAIDTSRNAVTDASPNALTEAEMTADGSASLFPWLDKNRDDLVDMLEFASGAAGYLSLKGIEAASAASLNNSCATCAPGWQGMHCNDPMTRVEIKIAVRASQAYFSAQKQEALRRAVATGLEWRGHAWNQARIVVKSVVTTETEGQLMHAELLAGNTVPAAGQRAKAEPFGNAYAAAVFLANSGSNFYQATLWESLWYLHVVCPTNCSVRVDGDQRTWRTPVRSTCTGAGNSRVFALAELDCENYRNDNSFLGAEDSRCEERSAACKDAAGVALVSQPGGTYPANRAACIGVTGQTWDPTIISSGGTSVECLTPASGNTFMNVRGGVTGICLDTVPTTNAPTARVVTANLPTCTGTATGADAGKICDYDPATDSTAACLTGCIAADISGATACTSTLTNTQYVYVADYCLNSAGEKATMPLGHPTNLYPPHRTACSALSPPCSGTGQVATFSLWFQPTTATHQVECEQYKYTAAQSYPGWSVTSPKYEFCIKNEEFCIKDDEFCI